MKSVAEEIRELANRLEKINQPKVVKEADYDDEGDIDTTDMDLDDVGAELDQDDDGGKGFNQDPMTDQLEKVAQSEGDDIVNPQRTVITDDGKEHMVLPAQATTLGILARTDKVKPNIRAQFQKDIQTSAGLEYFLSNPEGHNFVKSQQIVQRFQKKYLS